MSKLEQKFLKEAQEGCFQTGIEDDGTVYALGATETGALFSMLVTEIPLPDGGAIYKLKV